MKKVKKKRVNKMIRLKTPDADHQSAHESTYPTLKFQMVTKFPNQKRKKIHSENLKYKDKTTFQTTN